MADTIKKQADLLTAFTPKGATLLAPADFRNFVVSTITPAVTAGVIDYWEIYNPARIGAASNYTGFDATGHQTMVGTARPWRDALTDALSLQQSGVGVSRNITEGTVDFAHNATWNATFTNADAMYLNVQLNHDRDHASLIYPHIHWFQAANYSPNWLLEYRWQKNGGGSTGTLTKVTSWTELACNNLAFNWSTKTGGSGTLHQISYSAGISPPTGSDISDIIQFRIYRDTTGASTTYTGVTCPYNTGGNRTAAVMAFDCHFQINSLGSTDEYTK